MLYYVLALILFLLFLSLVVIVQILQNSISALFGVSFNTYAVLLIINFGSLVLLRN
jgi:hypothetical protein